MKSSIIFSILFFGVILLPNNVKAQVPDTTKKDTLKSISSAYHLGKKKEAENIQKMLDSMTIQSQKANEAAKKSDKSAKAARKAFEDYEKKEEKKSGAKLNRSKYQKGTPGISKSKKNSNTKKQKPPKIKLKYNTFIGKYAISYLDDDVNTMASLLGGIKVGDIITHIDGKELMKLSQKEISKLLGQKSMTLKYKRGKTEGTFFLKNY